MLEKKEIMCIICGSEFGEGDLACPTCGWSPDPAATGRERRSELPELRSAAGKPAAALSHPAAPGTSFETGAFCHGVPPIADLGVIGEERFFLLSDAAGGMFCSLAFWGKEGFEFSVTLMIKSVLGLAVLPSGDPLVVGGMGDAVRIHRPPEFKGDAFPETRGHRSGWDIGCFTVNPEGKTLAAGIPSEGKVRSLDLADFSESVLFSDLPGAPKGLAFSADGRTLAVACSEGSLLAKPAGGGRAVSMQNPGTPAGLVAVAALPRGGWAGIFDDDVVALWSDSGETTAAAQMDMTLNALAVDPLTGRIALGSLSGEVQAWSPDVRICFFNQKVHEDRVVRLVWPRSNRLISAGRDGEGHLYFPGVGLSQ